jgi:tetratricopeptide (TPR) repeat protein
MIAPASRKIGKYEILHKLGRGGMADVYLAQDTIASIPVALKIIEHAPDPDTHDFIVAERRGAELQARLADVNPHVVRIFDSGDVDGFFYVAMEYIEGEDLAELVRRGPLDVDTAVDVARAVAQTLASAHSLQVKIDGKEFHGIIHGDIKPRNIRIEPGGEVRVLDFGIAKALSLSRRLTRNEFGSVPYGSPERLEAGEVNVHSDLWSLAVMLYEMVTGIQPYRAETTELLERQIRSRVPPPPAPEPCPEPLRRILIKAMAPEPEMRYQSAGEFDADLAAFREGGTVRACVEDLEATRRTGRAAVLPDDDDTRRTVHEAEESTEDTRRTKQDVAGPPAPARLRRPMDRFLAAVLLILIGFLSYVLISNIVLYKRAQRLAREIEAEQVTDPNEIWKRWTELSGVNSSSLLLSGPRKVVKQRFVAAADRVIGSYREGGAVYESGWKNARDQLARALALDPDNAVRGRLRLVEGHLARINGRTAAELNEAAAKFNEAQQLMPKSPDPQLGLARLYVYGLKDIDRAYQALQQAQAHGYELGNRERAQLADGYLERADRLFWNSRNVRGMPQEQDQVQRSKEDYQRALELYQAIAPFGNANEKIVRVQKSLEAVDARLQQIEHGDGGPLDAIPNALRKLKPLIEIWR